MPRTFADDLMEGKTLEGVYEDNHVGGGFYTPLRKEVHISTNGQDVRGFIECAYQYLEKGYGIESRELYDCLEDKKIEELSAEAIRQQVSEQSQPRAQIGQKG